MKKIIALILVLLLLTLSGCSLLSENSKNNSVSDVVSVLSEGENESSEESSKTESSSAEKSSENSVLTEEITVTTDNTETEIIVTVPENEVVVPVEDVEEVVSPITPPVTDTENDITELPEFEEETTSELEGTENYNTEHIAVSQSDYYQYSQMTDTEKEIYVILKSAVLSCKNQIDLSKFRINTDDAMLAIYRFRADFPQYFWVSHSVAFTYNSMNDLVSSVFLFYTDGTSVDSLEEVRDRFRVVINADRQKIVERQKEVNTVIEGILGQINADWSDYLKERYIHDYIAENMTYDNDAAENPYISENILKPAFDIYSGFIGKTGVCEAYAKMFQVLSLAVGINATQVTGVGHMWNAVLIDGEWYQIDVTFDDADSTRPMNNGVRYNYFNLSGDRMAADGYHTPDGTLYVPDCTSNKYLFYRAS